MTSRNLLTALFISSQFATFMLAQKPDIYFGDFKALKNQKIVNVRFDYTEVSVGKFEKEQDYLDEKIKEKNEDEAGSGDLWATKWKADRQARFHPRFFEVFNEKTEGKLTANQDGQSDYLLTVITSKVEPGFNVGIVRRPASINVEIWLSPAAKPDEYLGKLKYEKVKGRDVWGFDFDVGYRIQESYALTGKIFAKYLIKKIL